MADTRTANPEYQQDVDKMMVEYLLYKTIESHLALIALQIDHLSNGDGFQPPTAIMASKRQEAVKLHGDLESKSYVIHKHMARHFALFIPGIESAETRVSFHQFSMYGC